MNMDKQKVFISYKSEEFKEAKWVKDFLESHGISCWMAPMSITGGASYASEIPQAIRNSQVVVLILSEKCQTSKWVPREIDQAINDEKVVMPFMVENCQLRDEFQFYLTNVQRYPAYEDKDAAADKMLREIKAIIGYEEEKEVEQETEEPIPVKAVKTAPKKVSKEKKQKEKNAKKPLLYVGAVVACIVLLSVILSVTSKVTIAGETVKKSTYNITFTGKTITQEDAEKISKLKELGRMEFTDCTFKFENMSLLCNEKIYEMHFVNCNLDDQKIFTIPFDKMSRLSTLNLYGNPFEKTDGIKMAKSLVALNVSYTNVKNLEFICEMTRLETLCADGLGLTSIRELDKFSTLKVISLNENKLENLKGLEYCIGLECVFAENNQLQSLDGLENTTRLFVTYLNGNQLDENDFECLSKSAETLRQVHMDDNCAKSIQFLDGCMYLEKLSANHNQIEDANVISKLAGLKKLSLEGNKLTQFPDIKACTELKFIDVSHNQIQEVLIPSTCEGLEYGILDFSFNVIEKMTIASVFRFDLLDLYSNKIVTFDGAQNLSASNFMMDFSELFYEEAWKNPAVSSAIISNCPLDKQMDLETQFGRRALLCDGAIEEHSEADQKYTEIKEKVHMGIEDCANFVDSSVMF